MNILFHCWEYPPRGSGIGRYIFHMSQALRDAGHFTVVITSHGDEGPTEEQIENGVVYRSYRIEDIGTSLTTDLVIEKAKKHDVDWIEGVDHLGESAHLLSLKKRPPVVIKAHYNDVIKTARYSQVCYSWQRVLVDLACFRDRKRIARERRSLSHADLLIAPSERILREMEKQDLVLAPLQGLVPNPIPPLDNWVNKEGAFPTLLLVGRVDIGKGIEYLPRLVGSLISRFPELRVEIAGGDSYARFIGSTKGWLINKMGDSKGSIKILGELDRHALDEAYSRAWVVIVPSKWDTFPTVVLEAMIRGKAIVASFNGGMPEMLPGTSGKIVDPARSDFSEAVAGFLFDRLRRETVGRSAQHRARSVYAPDRIADTYINLLKTCGCDPLP